MRGERGSEPRGSGRYEQHVRRAVAGEHGAAVGVYGHPADPKRHDHGFGGGGQEHGHFVAGLLRQCERRDAAVQYGWDDSARDLGGWRVLLSGRSKAPQDSGTGTQVGAMTRVTRSLTSSPDPVCGLAWMVNRT